MRPEHGALPFPLGQSSLLARSLARSLARGRPWRFVHTPGRARSPLPGGPGSPRSERGRQARAELRPVRLPVTSPTLPHPRSRPAPSFLPSRARTLEAGNGSARLPPPGQTERPLGRGSALSRPPGRGSGAPPAGVEAHSVLPSFPIHPGSLGRKAPHTTSTHTSLLWRRAPEKPSLAAAFSAHTHGGKTRWLWSCLPKPGAPGP